MPPAANESQGLKIAVAAFVSLTVVLAVTSYFLYSSYSKAEEQRVAAESKAQQATKASADALQQYQDVRNWAGYASIEDFEAVKAAKKKDDDAILAQINSIVQQTEEAVKAAQAGGETNPKFAELLQAARGTAAAYAAEPNKSYKDSLSKVASLLQNLTALSTNLALNDVALRKTIEQANKVNGERLALATDATVKKAADLEGEHTRHEQQRQLLNSSVDTAQTTMATQSTEIATLNSKYDQGMEKSAKTIKDLQSILRNFQEGRDKEEGVLDQPDGRVTFVDYNRNEVKLDIKSGTGAKPQLRLTVFDRNASAIPTETPKARIQLTAVGPDGSTARIDPASTIALRPIRVGDIVYTPSWDANNPERFGLVGLIDINRDGIDDRADLIRMIEQSGGLIEFDLPPPSADVIPGQKAVARAYARDGQPTPPKTGRAVGELSSKLRFYVIDERGAYYRNKSSSVVPTAEDDRFLKEVSDAKTSARDNGVRPIPIDRLLAYFGYNSYKSLPPVGRAESQNKAASRALNAAKAAPKPATPAPNAEPK